jgi:ketosteroid isomerase-like protein
MKRYFVSMGGIATALLVLAACEHEAGSDTAAIADEIKRETRELVSAYNAGDIDTVVAKFAADAVIMPPELEPSTGTEAIHKLWSEGSAANKEEGITITLGEDTVSATGDVAWHSGSWGAKNAAGQDVPGGYYLEGWEKRDGKWQIVRMMWTLDHEEPASPPAEPPAEAPAEAPPAS